MKGDELKIENKIVELVQLGESINSESEYGAWLVRAGAYLSASLGRPFSDDFVSLKSAYNWRASLQMQLGHLEGLADKLESDGNQRGALPETGVASFCGLPQWNNSRRVFIVHGHDGEAKEGVARFLERLGLTPVILHEQPNFGRTIIEKFEVYSEVGFAVVLLTPDDAGTLATSISTLMGRARQNVILELGYFLGKLGRNRVCALYHKGVELPSDYQGVLYVEMDDAGAWKMKLAQELIQVNFSINITALVGG